VSLRIMENIVNLAAAGHREVTTLPLSPLLINKLMENGFIFVSNLQDIRPLDLAKELGVAVEDAQAILQCVKKSTDDVKMFSAKVLARSGDSVRIFLVLHIYFAGFNVEKVWWEINSHLLPTAGRHHGWNRSSRSRKYIAHRRSTDRANCKLLIAANSLCYYENV
jgi:hypothetical protein